MQFVLELDVELQRPKQAARGSILHGLPVWVGSGCRLRLT